MSWHFHQAPKATCIMRYIIMKYIMVKIEHNIIECNNNRLYFVLVTVLLCCTYIFATLKLLYKKKLPLGGSKAAY